MTDIRTVDLSGTELAVTDISGVNICIKNNGSATLYASVNPGVAADTPGVLPVEPGTSVILPDCKGAVYLLGRGKAVLAGGDTKFNLFSPIPGESSGSSAALSDCELIRCEERVSYEDGRVIDVSGAKYFGIRPKGDLGVEIAVLNGDTYANEPMIHISAGDTLDSYITSVPASGKIYITGSFRRYTLYTSNSFAAIASAVTAKICGLKMLDED